MKKLFFFAAALFAAVSFSACSDDDKDDNKDASIVGTWQITREVGYEIVPGEGKFDKDITYPIDDVNDDYGFYYTYTFNEDGSGTYKSFNYYENNQLQEEWSLKYSISNDVLTIPQEYEYNGTFKIEQLTKTQLVLFEEIDDDSYKAAITYTFKKIGFTLVEGKVTDFVKRLIYKTLLQSLSLFYFVYFVNNLIFMKIKTT